MKGKLIGNKGFSTLELLIAMSIFIVSISAIAMISFGAQHALIGTEDNSEALMLAKSYTEEAHARAQGAFAALVSASTTDGMYTKALNVTTPIPYKKYFQTSVSWKGENGVEQEIIFDNWITDRSEIGKVGGDTPLHEPITDWTNPNATGTVSLTSTLIAKDIDYYNGVVYFAAADATLGTKDLYVYSVSSNNTFSSQGSLNVGPGINALDLGGTIEKGYYLYAANATTTSQLVIVNASTITITASSTLANGGVGQSIFYHDRKVYLGTTSASGAEFYVFDVSDPATPSQLGSFEVGADVNEIAVYGPYAYVATSNDSKELVILDISDPSNIQEVGSLDAAGSEDGLSLALLGEELGLGRMQGASTSSPEFYIVDINDKSAPKERASLSVGADVNNLFLSNALAFLATNDSAGELKIIDMLDRDSLAIVASVNTTSTLGALDYAKDRIFIGQDGGAALQVIYGN